jgi:hypothetical protein
LVGSPPYPICSRSFGPLGSGGFAIRMATQKMNLFQQQSSPKHEEI